MLKYVIKAKELDEIMELLFRILDIRITFFTLTAGELDYLHIKQNSPFCAFHRSSSAEFEARCRQCDHEHLLIAKRIKNVHIYHCHAGLLEGIVPLYDRHEKYLGAIVFGQLRDKDRSYDNFDAQARQLLEKSRSFSRSELYDIGKLLKHIGEYIIEHEIIKYKNKPWTERLEDFIVTHLHEKLTLAKAAAHIDRSPSFVSQNFPVEFGKSFKSYVLELKMKRAVELLERGASVKQTAFELGFYDEFHFSKKFKKYFGVPPSSYKA